MQEINVTRHLPSVLVIIVTYNGMKWIDKCLGSLEAITIPHNIYVVDNGSTDGTQDYIKEHFPQTIFVQSPKNLGFGKANNLGLKYAIKHEYDYVYLLNQDAWLMTGTLEKLIDIQNKNPEYGILSPFQMQANMCKLDTHFVKDVCIYNNPYLLSDFYFQKQETIYDVPFVMAAHWLISKDCLSKVGGFSPTFPHYGEDDNYCDRVLYHGFRIGIVPACKAVHDRADREETKERSIYMNYIRGLVLSSNIESRLWPVKVIFNTLKTSIQCNSFVPFYDLLKLLSSIRTIKRNRTKGMKETCPFL